MVDEPPSNSISAGYQLRVFGLGAFISRYTNPNQVVAFSNVSSVNNISSVMDFAASNSNSVYSGTNNIPSSLCLNYIVKC